MRYTIMIRRLTGALLAFTLLGFLACSGAEEATPTPSAPTAPSPTPTVPSIVVPTVAPPTATPTASAPGQVVARPTATNTPTAVPAGDQPKYGGVINIAGESTGYVDPFSNLSNWNWFNFGNTWGQLVRLDPRDRVTLQEDLADNWELSGDGLTWTFHIREGIVDHEGGTFTAEDARWNIIRIKHKPNNVPGRRQGCMREFVRDILDDSGNVVSNPGAEVTGPNELTVRLVAPRGAFMGCVTSAFMQFQPSKYTMPIDTASGGEYRDLDFDKGEAIGTGPFKIVDLALSNFVKTERHDAYYHEGLPYLDGYNEFEIQDPATRTASFVAGRVDAFPLFLAPKKPDVDRMVQELGADEVKFSRVPAVGMRVLELNTRKAPFGPVGDPMADDIRWAIQLTLNRDNINKLAFDGIGFLAPPYYIGWEWIYTEQEWFDQFPGLDSTPSVKAQHIAEAKQLMEKHGFGPDNLLTIPVHLTSASGKNENEVIADQLREIYIDTKVSVQQSSLISDRIKNGDFDIAQQSRGAPFPDPDAFNISLYFSWEDGGFNYTGYENPKWRELYEQEVIQDSEEARGPLLREMAKIMYFDATLINYIRPGLMYTHRGNWRGYTFPIHHVMNSSLEYTWLADQ
jgi:peptide/nickel transport system substrate-binding protein